MGSKTQKPFTVEQRLSLATRQAQDALSTAERVDGWVEDNGCKEPLIQDLADAIRNLAHGVLDLVEAVKDANDSAKHAANTASCLANGGLPD